MYAREDDGFSELMDCIQEFNVERFPSDCACNRCSKKGVVMGLVMWVLQKIVVDCAGRHTYLRSETTATEKRVQRAQVGLHAHAQDMCPRRQVSTLEWNDVQSIPKTLT